MWWWAWGRWWAPRSNAGAHTSGLRGAYPRLHAHHHMAASHRGLDAIRRMILLLAATRVSTAMPNRGTHSKCVTGRRRHELDGSALITPRRSHVAPEPVPNTP